MTLVYWERQEASLCGSHCLNALLQGPYIDIEELIDIAQRLEMETQQVLVGTRSRQSDVETPVDTESQHIDDAGNFSLPVLQNALQRYGISLYHAASTSEETHEQPTAYVLNHGAHWLTLRRLDDQWINLNSLLTFGPETFESEQYVNIWLQSMMIDGATLFLVSGELPVGNRSLHEHPDRRGAWYTLEQCKDNAQRAQAEENRQNMLRQGNRRQQPTVDEEAELQAAMLQSLQQPRPIHGSSDDFDDADMAAAIAASLQQ